MQQYSNLGNTDFVSGLFLKDKKYIIVLADEDVQRLLDYQENGSEEEINTHLSDALSQLFLA